MRTEPTTVREDAADVRNWALDRLASGVAVPIFRELPADLDTPVSAYLKLRDGSPSFLLESVEGGERLGRYSFVGASPRAVVEFRDDAGTITRSDGSTVSVAVDDPLTLISAVLDERSVQPNPELPRFQGGAVGFLGYDAAARFERLPVPAHDPLGAPDGMWMYCEDLIVFDHVNHVMRMVSLALPDGDPVRALRAAEDRVASLTARIDRPLPAVEPSLDGPAESPIQASVTRAEFERAVERAKEYIAAGDIIQVVPSLRLSRELAADAFDVYRVLRRINPSPYMFHLDFGSLQLVGASPEMLVQSVGSTVRTRPIAGTLPRGSDDSDDERLARELLADPKERAEHVMLVDLGRNDIGRVGGQRLRACGCPDGGRAVLARHAHRERSERRTAAWPTWRRCAACVLPGGDAHRGAKDSKRWRSSRSSRTCDAGLMGALWATSRIPEIWTRRSPFARWSCATAGRTSRRAPASLRIRCQHASTTSVSTRPGP